MPNPLLSPRQGLSRGEMGGLNPLPVMHEGCPPLLGHQGFSQEGKDPPEQPERQSEVQARGVKGSPRAAETWPRSLGVPVGCGQKQGGPGDPCRLPARWLVMHQGPNTAQVAPWGHGWQWVWMGPCCRGRGTAVPGRGFSRAGAARGSRGRGS